MYFKIHELRKQGKKKSEIAEILGITRKTVKKYFNMDIEKYLKYQSQQNDRNKIFEKYREDIIEIFSVNKGKTIYNSSIYDYLEEKYGKLPATEKTLRNYVRYLKNNNKVEIVNSSRIYKKVPQLPYGKQMQLDFGEYRQTNGSKLYIFATVLSVSRYKFVKFQETPFKTMDVILHLLDCFDHIGGKPEEIVIDQDKLMVVSENHGEIIYTKDFRYFLDEMELKMYVCRKADPESKGKVENLVKFVKINFLNTRCFDIINEANKSGLEWMNRRANGKISQATKKVPLQELEEERKHLQPNINSIFRKTGLFGREERIAKDNYISVNSNFYGLPVQFNDKQVDIYLTKYKIFIFDKITGNQIAEYDLSLLTGEKLMHREFRRESKTLLEDLKQEISGYFKNDLWYEFLENNFKAFPRYVRDQCIEARKYFNKKKIDPAVLNEAIKFCLSNKTLSFSNLHDTYIYFNTNTQEAVDFFPKEYAEKLFNDFHNQKSKINIQNRSLKPYSEIVSRGGSQ